jgi:hypothetical protein
LFDRQSAFYSFRLLGWLEFIFPVTVDIPHPDEVVKSFDGSHFPQSCPAFILLKDSGFSTAFEAGLLLRDFPPALE